MMIIGRIPGLAPDVSAGRCVPPSWPNTF